jgi:hypothetical protein
MISLTTVKIKGQMKYLSEGLREFLKSGLALMDERHAILIKNIRKINAEINHIEEAGPGH